MEMSSPRETVVNYSECGTSEAAEFFAFEFQPREGHPWENFQVTEIRPTEEIGNRYGGKQAWDQFVIASGDVDVYAVGDVFYGDLEDRVRMKFKVIVRQFGDQWKIVGWEFYPTGDTQ
jgi:hypothetical protein